MNAALTIKKDEPRAITMATVTRTAGRAADLGMMAAPPCFVAVTAALETAHPAYSRVADTVSELVWGPYGWLETMLFCLFGLMLSFFAWRLRGALGNGLAVKIGTAAMALMGVAFLVIAVFPTRVPGSDETLTSLIHKHTAQSIAALFPLACFLLLPGFKCHSTYHRLYAGTVIAGTLGLAFNLAGLATMLTDIEWLGAIERAVLLNGLAWLSLTGYYLWLGGTHGAVRREKAGGFVLGTARLHPVPVTYHHKQGHGR